MWHYFTSLALEGYKSNELHLKNSFPPDFKSEIKKKLVKRLGFSINSMRKMRFPNSDFRKIIEMKEILTVGNSVLTSWDAHDQPKSPTSDTLAYRDHNFSVERLISQKIL